MDQSQDQLVAVELADGDLKYVVHLTPQEIEEISADETKYNKKLNECRFLKNISSASEDAGSSSGKWNSKNIKLLLEIRLGLEQTFINPTCKKVKLWQNIADKMMEQGYSLSGTDCHSKFRNLLQTYKLNKEKRLKSTGESKISWEYFNIFDEVLGSKASVVPPTDLLSSSLNSDISEDNTDYEIKNYPKENNSRRKISRDKYEMSLQRYLYLKEQKQKESIEKSDIKWTEKKELKRAEIDAINKLADAILQTVKKRKLSDFSDSE